MLESVFLYYEVHLKFEFCNTLAKYVKKSIFVLLNWFKINLRYI